MKVGDLVRCRPRNDRENYDAWLGIIIDEPDHGDHVVVQWACSDGRSAVEIVNHMTKELELISESR